jgi:hypothetical protein
MPRYATFREFYPYYLSEHVNLTCRRLHFVGTSLGLLMLIAAAVTLNPWWLLAGLLSGYVCAWAGHFLFEKNRPATFTYPLWSFAGDWVMWKDILTGRMRF